MYKLLWLGVLFLAQVRATSKVSEETIVNIFGTPESPAPVTTAPPSPANKYQSSRSQCKTENGTDGVCVVYYLCNANKRVIEDGKDLIDKRNTEDCPSFLENCCIPSEIRRSDDPITPRTTTEMRTGCGWANPNGAGMATKGDIYEAKFGEFPWVIAILRTEPIDDNYPEGEKIHVYVGGGSLIHPSVVLTSANNVAGDHITKVRAGEWDTKSKQELHPYQDRDVKSKAVHENFNEDNLFFNIALLFLNLPMDLAPNVGLVCLPPARERVPEAIPCIAAGWGKDKFDQGKYQNILKKVKVPVVGRQNCEKALRTTRLGYYFNLHESFMCAGGEAGVDACNGDGGAPLVCPIKNERARYMQSGIVAWGIGCGDEGIPGVYVDVAQFRDWIDRQMTTKGLATEVYTYRRDKRQQGGSLASRSGGRRLQLRPRPHTKTYNFENNAVIST